MFVIRHSVLYIGYKRAGVPGILIFLQMDGIEMTFLCFMVSDERSGSSRGLLLIDTMQLIPERVKMMEFPINHVISIGIR